MSDDNYFSDKWDKVLRKFASDFKDTVESKSNSDVQNEILKAESIISDLEKDMENDVKLQTLKEDLKILTSGYRNEINTEKAKTKYCLYLLKQRGAM